MQAHLPTVIDYQALKFLKIVDVLDNGLISLSALTESNQFSVCQSLRITSGNFAASVIEKTML